MATTERNRPTGTLSDNALAIEAMLGRVKTERDTLPPDTVIGGFVLREVLQRDDISVLYGATASASGAAVCIEEYLPSALVVRGDDRTLRLRTPADAPAFAAGAAAFQREAGQLAVLDHPALMRTGPLWEAHGSWYRLVPWLDGDTLATLRAADATPPAEADLRRWLLPVLDALDAVHASGRIHGDVRPGKLWRKRDGQVQLRDFSAARAAIAAVAPWRVQWPEGECRPPELADVPADGAGAADALPAAGPWSDLYALAASVFWLVSGQPPVAAVLRAEGQPAPDFADTVEHLRYRGFTAHYSHGLVLAVDAALQLDPAARPRSAAAFRALLDTPAPVRPQAEPAVAAAPAVAPAAPAAAPLSVPPQRPVRPAAHEAPQEPVWSLQPPAAAAAATPFAVEFTGARVDPTERSQRALAAFRAVRDSEPPPRASTAARWPWAIGGALAGAMLAGAAVFWWLQPSVSEADRLLAAAAARDQAAVDAVMRAPMPAPAAASAAPVAPVPQMDGAQAVARPAPPMASASADLPPGNAAPAAADGAAPRAAPASVAGAGGEAGTQPMASDSAAPPAIADRRPAAPVEEILTEERTAPPSTAATPAEAPAAATATPRTAAATAPARGARTGSAVVAAAPPAPSTPSAVCAPRTNFSLYQCMQTQCRQDRFYSHPECIRLRLKDELP